MAQIIINTGNVSNDGTGDPLRTAFNDTNINFTEVFTAGPVGSNIQIANNSISTTNTNGNLVLTPNGIGAIVAAAAIMPDIPGVRMIGSNANPFNTVYSQYIDANLAVFGGNLYVGGNLNVQGNTVTVGYSNLTVSNTNITLAHTASNSSQADGAGLLIDGANTGFTYSYGANSWISNIAITADTFIGDGANLSNIIANVNSQSLLGNILSSTVTHSNLTAFGLIANLSAAGIISTSGNVYANSVIGNFVMGTLIGDGANITNISANAVTGNIPYAVHANTALTANLAALATQAINADTALYAINANIANSANTATSAITANTAHYAVQADMANSAVVAGMAEQLSPLANLSIVGNITTGGYFIGDGGFISNITVSTTFGNSNVTSLLSSGNVTTDYVTTGNIQGDYFIGNGAYLTGISGGNANTGNITFNGTTMSGPTGSSDGYSVYIQPSADFINTLQILPTADHDIHLFEKSGNAITLGNYGESQITVNGPASANANITIQSAGNIWTFDAVGNLTVPGNLLFPGGESFGIAGANTFTFNNSGRILTDNVVTILSGGVVSANVEIATVQSNGMDLNNWIFDSSVNGNLTLPTNTSSINYANGHPYGGSANTIADGSSNVTVAANANVTVNANTAQWTFGTDGNLTAPGTVIASNFVGTNLHSPTTGTNIQINDSNVVINPASYPFEASWTFDRDGTLTLPVAQGSSNGLIAATPTTGITLQTLAEYNTVGAISSGSGYSTAAGVATTGGNGTGLTVDIVVAGVNNYIQSVVVNNPGVGYLNNDNISITGGDNNGGFILQNPNPSTNSTTFDWTFDAAGNLTTPGDISAIGNISGDIISFTSAVLANAGATTTTSQVRTNQNPPLGTEAYGIEMYTSDSSNPSVYSSVSSGTDYVGLLSSNAGNANIVLQGGYGISFTTSNASGGAIQTWTFEQAGDSLFPGNISTIGNVTADYFIGDGGLLSNLQVSGSSPVSTTGNVAGGNLITTGSISASGNIIGNSLYIAGSSNILGNLNVQGNITFINSNVITTNDLYIDLANNQSTYNNINGAGLQVGNSGGSALTVWTYKSLANVWFTNVGISATGNITGNYIIGNGSQLTGLPATYSNATAASFLAAFGSNTISTTGSITSGNISGGNILTG